MNQIRTGLNDINQKNEQLIKASHFDYSEQIIGNSLEITQLHPDLVHSQSIDEPKNRIARSIKLMSLFINDFEGLQSSALKANVPEEQVHVLVNNQISNNEGPKKITLVLPQSTKIGELKDKIG